MLKDKLNLDSHHLQHQYIPSFPLLKKQLRTPLDQNHFVGNFFSCNRLRFSPPVNVRPLHRAVLSLPPATLALPCFLRAPARRGGRARVPGAATERPTPPGDGRILFWLFFLLAFFLKNKMVEYEEALYFLRSEI